MTGTGLLIDSNGDGSSPGVFFVQADARTPSGEVSIWHVEAPTCDPGLAPGTCLSPVGASCRAAGGSDPDAPPNSLPGQIVRCNRTAPGIRILAGGGDDVVSAWPESDPMSVDLGAGDDQLRSEINAFPGLRSTNSGFGTPTGPWHVTGGEGNDTIEGSSGGNTIEGGPGNDTIHGFPVEWRPAGKGRFVSGDRPDLSSGDSIFGGSGNDYIDPGVGADAVSGGDGNDTFNAGGEEDLHSPDAFDGGNGFDTIDYSRRTSDIFFDSGSTQSGSIGVSPHELDRDSRIEHVILGSGNDTALSLIDVLPARTFEGGEGNDTLNGSSSSNDTLIGGPGVDRLNGFGGNDVLDAKDGIADAVISCGEGIDLAKLDLKDPNPLDANQCETITREAVKEAPTVRIVSARRTRRGAAVTLACPRNDDRACSGLLDAGGAAVHYAIARGRRHRVILRGARARRLRVHSLEQGAFGEKTVIRSLKVARATRRRG